MSSWKKIKVAMLIASCISSARCLLCPNKCKTLSNYMQHFYNLATCNTMTSCPVHPQCVKCKKMVPQQTHTCPTCGHEWTVAVVTECPRLQPEGDQHHNPICKIPNTAAAA
ncbi:hypothetical protein PGT21_027058 [Puccinia graminis f. sp. tritici]|uniref:RING-type domain-containing protein n=1 Tax=Puccinia graminis f. sp. tritici TaxID=56615 RepID=A0A5B0SC10_PUCGR|nr:hypothetical protein PGT21_027058 [Puccinia graminis f. sp. tritici]KAA1135055.1 hypothetical protein PGTUg99_017107 [Puccinia graminis f. sp. tritici]KAA1137678.1 hypothetical protein PGTUg99_024313 [Puccinia graminis f. sp. tritici]